MVSSRMFIHENVIGQYTLPGGDVYSYARDITREIEAAAKIFAPFRTGTLMNSIKATSSGSNQVGCNFRVGADAPYAKYVVRLTTGKGVPKPMFGGRRRGTGSGRTWTLYGQRPGSWGVKGQYARYQSNTVYGFDGYAANTFLQDALRIVLRMHRLI